jgi:hypothetical protein
MATKQITLEVNDGGLCRVKGTPDRFKLAAALVQGPYKVTAAWFDNATGLYNTVVEVNDAQDVSRS